MASDAYIQIDGIPGEVLDEKHKDWIEVLDFDYGAIQPISTTATSAGGASAERVTFEKFLIYKEIDKASPKIFEACCSGKHIKKVVLSVNRAGGDKVTYFTIELGDAMVASMKGNAGGMLRSEGGETSGTPIEVIQFTFATIKLTYNQQDRTTGQVLGSIPGGWDCKQNKVIA